jgi:SNF2 family DNA or RNA helicase
VIYSSEQNAIVYNVKDPLAIARACPDARRLYNGFVAVRASLPNLQALTKAGLPTIAPMDLHYDWPGRFKPFHAQRLTANFLALNPRAFVLSDMGTGKTLAALWAADYVMSQHPPGTCRALIVSPLSTLRRVWSDEIFQHFMGRRKCVVVHGSAQQREKQLAQDADFYIINHDGVGVGATASRYKGVALRGLARAICDRSDIRMVIIDEASAYRDPGTSRHRVARHLLAGRDYLWLMTGTPTPNGPLDAYGMAKLVNNAYGESLTSYKMRVMHQLTQFKWLPRPGAMDEAKKLLSPSVRFSIEDCVGLPPCVTLRMEAELSAEQKAHYKKMKDELALTLKSGAQITAANEGVLRSKLIQISCGAIYDAAHEAHFIDAKPRFDVLREALAECNEKAIVFAPLTSVLHLLYKELSEDYSCAIINGAVSQKERSELFRRFTQEPEPRILIADPQTMAHGLTLTAATTIVWFAPCDRTELYLQANKRIHRPGQSKTTRVVQIASTAVEREIYKRLEANESLQGVLLKMAEGN